MQVATDLLRDLAAQRSKPRQVVALGRLGEPPPGVQLGGTLGGAAATLDQEGGRAEVLDQMRQLGSDVAGVEIDHHSLHLQDMFGAGLALLGDSAGDDIDGAALARGPVGVGAEGGGGVRSAGTQMLCGLVRGPWPWSTKPRTGISPSQ